MIKTFNYINSKGESKKHSVAVLSETPDYLMGIDLFSIIKKIIDNEDWFEKNFYMLQNKKIVYKSIIDLIQHCIVIQNEMKNVANYSVLEEDVDVFYNTVNEDLCDTTNLENTEKIKHFNLLDETNPIPNFFKAKDEYNKIISVFKFREPTIYKDLKESRSAEKKPIEGFDNEWMKSFKNFKKSGIQKEN